MLHLSTVDKVWIVLVYVNLLKWWLVGPLVKNSCLIKHLGLVGVLELC
jgi:hypothetical protein